MKTVPELVDIYSNDKNFKSPSVPLGRATALQHSPFGAEHILNQVQVVTRLRGHDKFLIIFFCYHCEESRGKAPK